MPVVPLKNVYAFERYLADTDVRRPGPGQHEGMGPQSPFGRVLTERQVAHRQRMLDFAARLRSKHTARVGRRSR